MARLVLALDRDFLAIPRESPNQPDLIPSDGLTPGQRSVPAGECGRNGRRMQGQVRAGPKQFLRCAVDEVRQEAHTLELRRSADTLDLLSELGLSEPTKQARPQILR